MTSAYRTSVHRWLYDHPGILHRDLSSNNVICRFADEANAKGGPERKVYGVLMDYDLSSWTKDLEANCTGASQRPTGIPPYGICSTEQAPLTCIGTMSNPFSTSCWRCAGAIRSAVRGMGPARRRIDGWLCEKEISRMNGGLTHQAFLRSIATREVSFSLGGPSRCPRPSKASVRGYGAFAGLSQKGSYAGRST